MTKGDGKIGRKGIDQLDPEHELPGSDERPANSRRLRKHRRKRPRVQATKWKLRSRRLRAESAAYLDRLARLQAEFDNFRKRAAREQQEYREYALAEALKQLLLILDSLDRALKTEAAGPRTSARAST